MFLEDERLKNIPYIQDTRVVQALNNRRQCLWREMIPNGKLSILEEELIFNEVIKETLATRLQRLVNWYIRY